MHRIEIYIYPLAISITSLSPLILSSYPYPVILAAQSSCFVQDFDYGQADIKKITKVDSAASCLAQVFKIW